MRHARLVALPFAPHTFPGVVELALQLGLADRVVGASTAVDPLTLALHPPPGVRQLVLELLDSAFVGVQVSYGMPRKA